jgi:hypothetical protein
MSKGIGFPGPLGGIGFKLGGLIAVAIIIILFICFLCFWGFWGGGGFGPGPIW